MQNGTVSEPSLLDSSIPPPPYSTLNNDLSLRSSVNNLNLNTLPEVNEEESTQVK